MGLLSLLRIELNKLVSTGAQTLVWVELVAMARSWTGGLSTILLLPLFLFCTVTVRTLPDFLSTVDNMIAVNVTPTNYQINTL